MVWIFLVGSFSVLTGQRLSADKPDRPREGALNKCDTIENFWSLPPVGFFCTSKTLTLLDKAWTLVSEGCCSVRCLRGGVLDQFQRKQGQYVNKERDVELWIFTCVSNVGEEKDGPKPVAANPMQSLSIFHTHPMLGPISGS